MQRLNPAPLWFSYSGGVLQSLASSYFATGSGSPGHSPVAGGCYVPGIFEADGAAYCDSTLDVGSTLTVVGDVTLSSGGTISSTLNGDISIVPNGTGITKIGDATAYSFSSPVNDDLSVSGRLGVKGTAYFSASESINASYHVTLNGASYGGTYVRFGSSSVWGCYYMNTDKGLQMALGSDGRGNNVLHLVALANVGVNYGWTTMQADPLLAVHSRTAAATSTTQYVALSHDTANARVRAGNVAAGGAVEISAAASAPTLGTASSVAMYLDEGNHKLKFAVKYADGITTKTAELALT